ALPPPPDDTPPLPPSEPQAASGAPFADLEPAPEQLPRAATGTALGGSSQEDGEPARRPMLGAGGARRGRAAPGRRARFEVVPRARHLRPAYDRVAACRRWAPSVALRRAD